MVIIFFFDDTQTLLKIETNALSIIQTQELNDDGLLEDSLSVSIPNDEKLLDAQYMAVKSHEGNAQAFDMYRIVDSQTSGEVTYFTGIQLAYYELAGYVVEDLRPTDRGVSYVAGQLLADTEWRVGYVDDLPNVTTNFYYLSAKDAFAKLQSAAGCEVIFKVEISGQGVTDKWVEIYDQLGDITRKRFTYGDSALEVAREINHNDIYTALIGQGEGEESGDGYGRKITFENVEWSIANGDLVDKPLGQKYVELPDMTAEYGIPVTGGKRPRIGVAEFDTESVADLLTLTYQSLVKMARPKVLFKANVVNIGGGNIGDTVTIHRYDLGIHYETRLRRVERDKLNENRTMVELGDVVHQSSTRKTNSIIRDVSNRIEEMETDVINYVGRTADGKNAIRWGNDEPEQARTGDLWYRDHPSINGERQMMIFDGTSWIEQEYRADMLTGTFDAQTLNVVNINVDSIVGNTSTFVQSAWNAVNSNVYIDGNGLHAYSATTDIVMANGGITAKGLGDDNETYFGINGIRLENGAFIERLSPSSDGMEWSVPGFMHFSAWGQRAFSVYETSVNFFRDINMTGNDRHVRARNVNANETNELRLNGSRPELGQMIFGSHDTDSPYVISTTIYDRNISSASQVGITGSGELRRISSARKYKTNIETVEGQKTIGHKLFDLKLTKWNDKEEINHISLNSIGTEPHTHYGLIAEDVESAGLHEFVDYQDGVTEGIYYDRLWIPLIPIAKDHEERIAELERKLANG